MIAPLLALFLAAAPADAGVAKAPAARAGRALTIAFTGDNGGDVAPCG